MKILSLRNCLGFPAVIYWIIRMLFLLLCKSCYDSIFLNPGSRGSEGYLSLIFAFTSVGFLPYDVSSNFKRDSVSLLQLASSSHQVHWFVPELACCSMIRTEKIALLRPKADRGFAQRRRVVFWIALSHSGWSRTFWADLSDGGSMHLQSSGDVSRWPAKSVYSILDKISESLESYESIFFPFLFYMCCFFLPPRHFHLLLPCSFLHKTLLRFSSIPGCTCNDSVCTRSEMSWWARGCSLQIKEWLRACALGWMRVGASLEYRETLILSLH